MPIIENPNKTQGASPFIEVDDHFTRVVEPGAARVPVALVGFALLPLLYPLSMVPLAGLAWLISEMLLVRFPEVQGPMRVGALLVPCLVLLVVLIRTEQWLGTFAWYRWPRHALRLLLPGLFFNVLVREDMGLVPDPDFGVFLADTFNNSTLLGATLGPMVGMQVLLFFAGWVRDDWHASLRFLRLRASGLD